MRVTIKDGSNRASFNNNKSEKTIKKVSTL